MTPTLIRRIYAALCEWEASEQAVIDMVRNMDYGTPEHENRIRDRVREAENTLRALVVEIKQNDRL